MRVLRCPEPRTEPPEPRFVRDAYGNEIYEGEKYYVSPEGNFYCDRATLMEAIVEKAQEYSDGEIKEKFGTEERILTWER